MIITNNKQWFNNKSSSCHSHQKGTKKPKMLKKNFESSFTFGKFKLFFAKKFLNFYISSYRGRATSKKIKTDELGINGHISLTCRMKNISKNQNLYPQQSQITLFTLP
jgi:hypothetical protein